jgi:hypothetical protein
MKNEITIPLVREENLVAAGKRRERYSLSRDIQAEEFNSAIAKRLEKDALKQESEPDDETKQA